ncbi:hypothetical protein [Chitinimonas sp.]|uniref:hypothetical protein n=1 Tax=Chitinimonas sp. TaxID=1934313 RepID=UPI002F938957
MTDLSTFIAEYTEADHPRLAFAWNGKHASEFVDANQDFRWQLVQACLAAPGKASPLLLQHLFLEDALWSKEAWGSPYHFADLAAALLTSGRESVLVPFAQGFVMSFDTFGACHELRLPPELVDQLALATQEMLGSTAADKERKPLEAAAELFLKLQQGSATQGWVQLAPGTPVTNIRVVWPRWYHRVWQVLSSGFGLRNSS